MIMYLNYNVGVDKSVAAFPLHLHFLLLQKACNLCFLLYMRRPGMTLGEIEKLQKDEKTKEEQIRIIRKERGRLLEEIHGKQQLLDRLDYMLHEMKKN